MDRDLLRQAITVVMTVATVVCSTFSEQITGTGKTVGEVSHQYPLALTPADYAFSIWGLIYSGLLVYAVYQALPGQRANPRLRKIGYWYVLSCVGNIAWGFIWLNEQITLSLLAMFFIFLPLLVLYIRYHYSDRHQVMIPKAERWCVQFPFSIYLGWITVASIVNVAVVLKYQHWNGWGLSAELWTNLLLIVATAIAIFIGIKRMDIVYVATLIWAFVAITIKNRLIPQIAVTSGLMILILLCVIVIIAIKNTNGRKAFQF
ncbi:tryptophan-rich sensory protein [Tengunoibacter tsumagoiensis]|uniref:Tryptophan-rich sensory protein n=1 Tax=Tengunoibacter tsumagoiensis TaxID=2014871 RepID=A0A401ZUT6_9CHLR|nr:tryptophan-rich sensory protein [Tengunoibacter tsumagoiensis]GCE10643.1 hypothetical protein KTT_05020 [Tengunoibacter tsumagoiensis]